MLCPNSSIRDLVEASSFEAKTGQNIFTYLNEHTGKLVTEGQEKVLLHYVVEPPVPMMKGTQSLKKIAAIEGRQFSPKKGGKIDIQTYVGEHSYVGPSLRDLQHITYAPMNLMAAEKAAHYFEDILQNVVSGKLV